MGHEVDYRNATVDGLLKLISMRNKEHDEVPIMLDMVVGEITTFKVKDAVKFWENNVKEADYVDTTHLKRIRKKTTVKPVILEFAICTVELSASLMTTIEGSSIFTNLRTEQVPMHGPATKEDARSWSDLYWPVSWKGNPTHQLLATAQFEMAQEQAIIDKLVASIAGDVPTATIMAEQKDGKINIVCVAKDSRLNHPTGHSVMNAIQKIADIECARRSDQSQGYLCHNLLVYTTHEPCIMCAMALVHSRIGRLIYLQPHPDGGIESSHYIGGRNDLNWTFETWRWIGPAAVPLLAVPA